MVAPSCPCFCSGGGGAAAHTRVSSLISREAGRLRALPTESLAQQHLSGLTRFDVGSQALAAGASPAAPARQGHQQQAAPQEEELEPYRHMRAIFTLASFFQAPISHFSRDLVRMTPHTSWCE
ncbi:unnamed protein product [Prorocentrum cordatum]|uniref:Uncharacterized protein n=1 Tax=Prorocentrum cordatum TaxID=2364126 RepID=A0ABN9T280_9DINO|nr:unnamed protein product [Polarella glacialis]